MPERARSRRSGVTGSPGYGVAAGLRAQGRVDSCSVADDLHFHFHLTFRKSCTQTCRQNFISARGFRVHPLQIRIARIRLCPWEKVRAPIAERFSPKSAVRSQGILNR